MREDLTDITVVLDKSGSMGAVVDDVIGGFNTFLQEQLKAPGEALMSLVFFDTAYSFAFTGKPLEKVDGLTRESYRPGGMTALLDATAKAILDTGARLEKMDEKERPGKVVLVIMTDGHENSSKEHNRQQVHDMIEHQKEKYNWHVIFLGANVDAFAEGGKIGVQAANAMNFGPTGQGVNAAFKGVSDGMRRLRGTRGIPCSADYNYFTQQEQQEGENTTKGDSLSSAVVRTSKHTKTGRTKSKGKA